jgi:AcrR family transcriptional regulator
MSTPVAAPTRAARGRRPARPDRLAALIETATRVFIAQGYRRTQMADVAAALGVAKGTLYLYVESKAALFDLVIRHASDQVDVEAAVPALPLRTPPAGATLAEVERRLTERDMIPALGAALERPARGAVRAELEGILRELFAVLSANRTAIKLVDRCATDYPELAALWFVEGRVRQLDRLVRYLATPSRRPALRSFPDERVAARIAFETITFWAVHRHWDPAPQSVDEQVAEDTAVAFVLGALVQE